MERVTSVLKEVFPALDRSLVVSSLRFGDIPLWDSMSAINLVMLTEDTFKVKLRGVFPHDGMTVGAFVNLIREKGGDID